MTSPNPRRGLSGRTKAGMVLHIPGPISADQDTDSDQGTASDSPSPRHVPRDLTSQCVPSLTLQSLRQETRGPMTPPLRHRQPAVCVTKEEVSQTGVDTGSVVKNNVDNDVGNGLFRSQPSDLVVVSGSLGSGQGETVRDVSGSSGSDQGVGKRPEDTTSGSSGESHVAPVIQRKPSLKSRSHKTTPVSEYGDALSSEPLANGSQPSPGRGSPSPNTLSAADAAAQSEPPASSNQRRRISFAADSVLTAVIQDGDTAELLRILTGRHGPGLVQTRVGEEGGVRGVDVCQTNHVGLSALHQAVLANNLDAAKLLLCHGADVNAQDVHGFSPLHTAAACGFLPLTSLLVLFGADVFAVTLDQELAVDVAKDLNIVRLLTVEMVRLVHQELWVSSALRAHAEELWVMVRKLLACVVLFVLQVILWVRTAWGKHGKSD